MLDQPHHDGSALYADKHHLWVRVPAGFAAQDAYVRTVIDGEPRFLPLRPDPARTGAIGGYGPDDKWLTATLPEHNPVTPYRFLFGSRWLNATGLHEREVTDINDFKLVTHEAPPSWMHDAIVYEIFPDRFASTSPKTPPDWAIGADWDTTPVIEIGRASCRERV